MNNDEIIRMGNQLIAAARDGKIGLSEEEMRGLQKSYLRREKMGNSWEVQKLFTRLGAAGLAIGFLGVVIGGDVSPALFLFVGGAGVFLQFTAMKKVESEHARYIEIVTSEYPKLSKKEAA